jgi:hypothetical protein
MQQKAGGDEDLSYDPELMTYVPEEEAIPSLDAVLKAEGGEGADEEAASTEERKVCSLYVFKCECVSVRNCVCVRVV